MASLWIPIKDVYKYDIVNLKGGSTAPNIFKNNKKASHLLKFINFALYDTKNGINIVNIIDEYLRDGYLFATKGFGIIGNNELVWTDLKSSVLRLRDFGGGAYEYHSFYIFNDYIKRIGGLR